MKRQSHNIAKYFPLTKVYVLVFLSVLITCSHAALANANDIYHRLWIELIPEKQSLKGVDRIRLDMETSGSLVFHLSDRAVIKGIFADKQKVPFQFRNGILKVPAVKSTTKPMDLVIEYEVVFDDPVPDLPINTDNPGFGVTGTISEKGTFLLSGAQWRPVIPGYPSLCSLTVKAPKGVIVVTAGKSLGQTNEGGHTISQWEIDQPVRGLSLSAGNYQVFENNVDKIGIYAFLFPESAYLAKDYMDAAAKYISFYQSLFGSYPFPKFAIVENFFPTGYGFASYTLLGSQVLRLPFIIETSLGHEIAHSWWGNGVYADYSHGNWSEGLTTYVADYLFRERKSEKEGRTYRLQMLRNYATLVNPSNDFPLAEFTGRIDPVTKVIGYDKGAMFFHMLRKQVGEENFWTALKTIYNKYLFKIASWNDFREIFEEISGKPLKLFFEQWINRPGAPELTLEHVEFIKSANGGTIRGKLVQNPPFFELWVPVSLETDRGKTSKTILLNEKSSSFEFETENIPKKLMVDPEVDIFRKMVPSEIPPTVNSLKASGSVLIVMADSLHTDGGKIAKMLMEGLGVKNYKVIHEKELQGQKVPFMDILFIGMPSQPFFLKSLPENLALQKDGFFLNNVGYFKKEDVFFGVFENPDDANHVLAFFIPLSVENSEVVARKIPHYGKYGYLAFSNGQNMDKGDWTLDHSPLIYQFDTIKVE